MILNEVVIPNVIQSNQDEDVLWARGTANNWDAIQSYSSTDGTSISVRVIHSMNWVAGTAQVSNYEMPYEPTHPNWHLPGIVNHSSGSAYISTLALGNKPLQYTYDASTHMVGSPSTYLGTVLAGEVHNLVIGADGNVYTVSADVDTANVCVAKYGTANLGTTYYRNLGTAQNPSLPTGVAYADGWLYVGGGRNPYELVAYDVTQGTAATLISNSTNLVNVTQYRYGALCNVTADPGHGGTRSSYWLYAGGTYYAGPTGSNYAAPPWPGTSQAAGTTWVSAGSKPAYLSALAQPRSGGSATWGYTLGTATMWISGTVLTKTPDAWRVWYLSSGTVMAATSGYLGVLMHTAGQGTVATWPGVTNLSHYDSAELDGTVYMAGYASGRVLAYDLSKPWNTGTLRPSGTALYLDTDADANPTFAFDCKNTLSQQIDCLCAIRTAGDCVYAIGQDRRSGYSTGILVRYHPASDTLCAMDALAYPWLVHRTDYMTVTPNGRWVAVSTHRVADGADAADRTTPKPTGGCVIVYDRWRSEPETSGTAMAAHVTRAITPEPYSKGAGKLVAVDDDTIVGWTAIPTYSAGAWSDGSSSRLYRASLSTGKVLQTVTLAGRASPFTYADGQTETADISLGPDGSVYAWYGSALMRIDGNDITRSTVVGTATAAGRMAWSPDGDLYLSGVPNVRMVAGVTSL